jgi:hypothetical protein
MGKKSDIFYPQIVDLDSLIGTDWDAVEKALRRFEAASSDFIKTTVRRSKIGSLADRAILGNLLLKARYQYCLNASSSAKDSRFAILQDGEQQQKRSASGQFKTGDGFLVWLRREFPGISIRSAYHYMNLAENIGLKHNRWPKYILAPAVQCALRRPQTQLYLKPDAFQDMLRKEKIQARQEPQDQEFEKHLFVQQSLAELRELFGQVHFALKTVRIEDVEETEAFFEEALNKIRDTKEGRGCPA